MLTRYRNYRHHEINVRVGLLELLTNIHALDAFSAFLMGTVRCPWARDLSDVEGRPRPGQD